MAVHRETCRRKELAGHHTCGLVLPGNHQQLHPVRHKHEEVGCYQQDTETSSSYMEIKGKSVCSEQSWKLLHLSCFIVSGIHTLILHVSFIGLLLNRSCYFL